MICALILVPLLGASAIKLCGRFKAKCSVLCLIGFCALELALSIAALSEALQGKELSLYLPAVCNLGLGFRADGYRSLYCAIAAFMWLETALLSPEYFDGHHKVERYYFFNQLTLCGVIGMLLSDDLYTAFIFFEIMSMASYPWVAQEESPEALRAGATYLGVAVLGGMVTLMGIMLLYHRLGSVAFEVLKAAPGEGGVYTASALVLFGFLAKAGAFPMHIWLPKAHPVAPAPASALLSGLLTKAGLFGVLVISFRVFPGNRVYGGILLGLALTTMLLGAVLGVFSNNLKRTLACSSMSQIGYILTGVAGAMLLGEEGALPAAGALSHMVNHSSLKLLLFMTAGAIYMHAHSLDLNVLRGYGRKKPLLHACYLLGALGLAGVPGFNGYVSKTMIHEGLVEAWHHLGAFPLKICEWIFLFAAGLTTAYMLKTYLCLFIQKNADEERQRAYDAKGQGRLTVVSAIALIVSMVPIPLLGIKSSLLTDVVSRLGLSFLNVTGNIHLALFSLENLRGGAITLVIGTLVYLFFVRKVLFSRQDGYLERWPKGLDLEDAVYRPVFCRILPNALYALSCVLNGLGDGTAKLFRLVLTRICTSIEGIGDTAAGLFALALSLASRVLEVVTDALALFTKELVLVNHTTDVRQPAQGRFNRALRSAGTKVQLALNRLKLKPRPDPREVTDLSYGSYFTNTVTFGLIICTLGIVFAFIYIFLRAKR